VIGFMDGVSLNCECTSEPVVQNSMYSGYHSDTMVNNLFAYAPDGRVIFCAINFPGSWHDGSIMANECLIFIRRLANAKCALIKAFPEAVMPLTFLLDPLVMHNHIT